MAKKYKKSRSYKAKYRYKKEIGGIEIKKEKIRKELQSCKHEIEGKKVQSFPSLKPAWERWGEEVNSILFHRTSYNDFFPLFFQSEARHEPLERLWNMKSGES